MDGVLLVLSYVLGIVGFPCWLYWITRPKNISRQHYYSDPCEEYEEDENDQDEIDYWVSRGWGAGDGPPPHNLR
jgi:hypothetical protein